MSNNVYAEGVPCAAILPRSFRPSSHNFTETLWSYDLVLAPVLGPSDAVPAIDGPLGVGR